MLTTVEAQAAILREIRELGSERVATDDAVGRMLRQAVVAERDQPPFDRVMMDGIALQHDSWAAGARRFVSEGIAAADDPGMHSSQNEQDNRHLARAAKVALLEPADSQEAKDFVSLAFDISERYETPVLLRTTTRIAHAKGVVEFGERANVAPKKYETDIRRFLVPPFARWRRPLVEKRLEELKQFSETFEFNRVEEGDPAVGVIASGVDKAAAEVRRGGAAVMVTHDPDVVQEFARMVGTPTRLDYLYLLTVADCMATGPKAWTGWVAALLRELFLNAHIAHSHLLHFFALGAPDFLPGDLDTLLSLPEVAKKRFCKMKGIAYVDGGVVAEAELTSTIVDR